MQVRTILSLCLADHYAMRHMWEWRKSSVYLTSAWDWRKWSASHLATWPQYTLKKRLGGAPTGGLNPFTFISQFSLTQSHSPLHSQFFTECDLLLPFSIYSILSSLRSSSSYLCLLPRLPVTSTLPFILNSITCLRRQFLRGLWPIQLALLAYYM